VYMFLSCTLVHRVLKLTYMQFRCKTSEVVARYRMNSPLVVHKKHVPFYRRPTGHVWAVSARVRDRLRF